MCKRVFCILWFQAKPSVKDIAPSVEALCRISPKLRCRSVRSPPRCSRNFLYLPQSWPVSSTRGELKFFLKNCVVLGRIYYIRYTIGSWERLAGTVLSRSIYCCRRGASLHQTWADDSQSNMFKRGLFYIPVKGFDIRKYVFFFFFFKNCTYILLSNSLCYLSNEFFFMLLFLL